MCLSSSTFTEAPSHEEKALKAFQPVKKQSFLPDGWTRGGSHPGRYEMGLDEGNSNEGSAAAFIASRQPFQQNKTTGFGTVCQKFYPKRIKLSAHLSFNLCGPESWTGIWVKVDLKTGTNTPRTFHLDNMADRKLTGSSQGKWVECEIVTDIPTNVEALTFGFLVVGDGITWASDFRINVVPGEVKPTGLRKHVLGKDRDTIVQELHAGLRKLSLSSPSLSAPTLVSGPEAGPLVPEQTHHDADMSI